MKCCFWCDLHLPVDNNALQYKVLEWALSDAVKKNADCIIYAGDVTCDGNLQTYNYFLSRLTKAGIPFLCVPGNSDLRDESFSAEIKKSASKTVSEIGGVKIFAINDCDLSISSEQISDLESADENSIVFMHHPIGCINEGDRALLLKWKKSHPKTKLFYAHEHVFSDDGDFISLPAMDPDKCIGESPSIIYYDTDKKGFEKSYYFCPVPTDIYDYFGISCYNPEKDIEFATTNGLRHLELRPCVLKLSQEKIVNLISKWRKQGKTELSIHLSEVRYENGVAFLDNDYMSLIELGSLLKAERFIQHVPLVSLRTVKEDASALDKIVSVVEKALEGAPKTAVIGVENMHMTSVDEPNDNRRFGYTPEEVLSFVERLSERCYQKVGVNFDIGHARNNAPYSQKYQISTWLSILGKRIVSYHVHQVKDSNGKFENHTAIEDVYGRLISFASLFKNWAENEIAHAPIIFEMRTDNAYETTLKTFDEHRKTKIIDLHSHTYYSNCSEDNPIAVINTAISNGVSVLGISDHNYGIGDRKKGYLKEISSLAKKFEQKIKILRGIELATYPDQFDLKSFDEIKDYDYCLIEHILEDNSIVKGDLFEFCSKAKIPCGIAHTDLFQYCDKYNYNTDEFFKEMAKRGIFWELNVSYDSIHGYREHQYVKNFLSDSKKIEKIKNSGVCISVGFDGHRFGDYDGFRVLAVTKAIKKLGLNTMENHCVIGKKINENRS